MTAYFVKHVALEKLKWLINRDFTHADWSVFVQQVVEKNFASKCRTKEEKYRSKCILQLCIITQQL